MMDVNITVKNRQFIVSFRTVRLDIDKAKIIEIIISTLPDADGVISLDLKGVKSIDPESINKLKSLIQNIEDIKVINLEEKYKKLVS